MLTEQLVQPVFRDHPRVAIALGDGQRGTPTASASTIKALTSGIWPGVKVVPNAMNSNAEWQFPEHFEVSAS